VSEQGLEPRVLRNTRGFFDGRSKLLVVVLGLAFIAVVTILDYLTGPSLSLSLLYLMPIGLVTWNLGRRWGSATVVVATIAGILADVLAAPGTGQTDPVPYWNAIVRFAVFLAFAMLLDTLRSIIDAQWERVEVEAERSSDLREMNDVKDTLLHAVSHDLKGPLAGILGAMQTIRRADQLKLTGVELNDLYGVIEQAGKKAARLVDDLLDLDRLRRGQLQPEREPTDVGELADRVALELPSLSGHPIRIESEPMLVDVDRAKVERIVENLLNNAARHTPAGTPVQVLVTEQGHGVVVVVEDEGPGVSDDIKDEIFEPFRQGASARGGVGIGLSLVQRFAELHGGTASVEDRPGGGARFVVTLPGDVQHVTRPAPLRAV
jgi:signal transduction histidine kinase